MEIYLIKKWEFDVHKFLDYANIHSKEEYDNCLTLTTLICTYIQRACPYEYDLIDGNSILSICDAIRKAL